MSIVKTPARAPRARRSPEAARENILAAAERLLTEKGPQALKLTDVAAAAGIAHATVLHHFGSIADVQTALMERMIRQLVAQILAEGAVAADPQGRVGQGARVLFDAFGDRGAARLAAWLELTGESRRLTMAREAVREVIANRLAPEGVDPAVAEDMVLVSVILAMGVGLFGRSLSELMGRPPDTARGLALDLLRRLLPAEGA
ncbi:MAG: TetR family transcriptional regulator [Phenylobacterium sp.]|uniref:TetR/AcrR family transcriptional regulator n=1 Tax=Phenylobacterium sp. TaxID=1871053 RepID=UPI0025D987F2|nr:TetR/AcrR family transcriptional regulator [Phenylobacterium sp.]MBI1196912.1 TetR family transcriptional regulator [Phenylobacterium sp.]